MASIEKFIEKVCVQTAVLWTYSGSDGYGGSSFAAPVEISCRWEDYDQTMEDDNSVEFVSQATLLVTQDVKMNDFLYLGTLTGIASNPDPMSIDGAYKVRSFRKIPMIFKTDIFVRKAYL
jgi:hypothetical protein